MLSKINTCIAIGIDRPRPRVNPYAEIFYAFFPSGAGSGVQQKGKEKRGEGEKIKRTGKMSRTKKRNVRTTGDIQQGRERRSQFPVEILPSYLSSRLLVSCLGSGIVVFFALATELFCTPEQSTHNRLVELDSRLSWRCGDGGEKRMDLPQKS